MAELFEEVGVVRVVEMDVGVGRVFRHDGDGDSTWLEVFFIGRLV